MSTLIGLLGLSGKSAVMKSVNNNPVVFHAVAGLSPKSGGPSRTVVNLCDAIASLKQYDVFLTYQSSKADGSIMSTRNDVSRFEVESSFNLYLKFGIGFYFNFRKQVVNNYSTKLIHNHGVWHLVNFWASLVAKSSHIPLIIQPRGMLEPWAINHRAWKKKLAMFLYQKRALNNAKLLVATSIQEYLNFRALGLKQPVAVIPNGVLLNQGDFESSKQTKSHKTMLFLSRVHPKKGLFNLLDAWAKVDNKGWKLKIAGPDEGGHLQEVMLKVSQLGLSDSVEYIGELEGEAKANAYQNADVFVLPTFSENFGVVVAEALSYGVPVITTKGAPWEDLEKFNCGWWVDIGVKPLVDALNKALNLTDDERHKMGLRARDYVQRYNWETIATNMNNVYSWLLGRAPKPDCVYFD